MLASSGQKTHLFLKFNVIVAAGDCFVPNFSHFHKLLHVLGVSTVLLSLLDQQFMLMTFLLDFVQHIVCLVSMISQV